MNASGAVANPSRKGGKEDDMKGFIRQRGNAWELRVFLGNHVVTGKRRYAYRTVHGGKREAQRVLAAMVSHADKGLAVRTNATVGSCWRHGLRWRSRLLAQDGGGDAWFARSGAIAAFARALISRSLERPERTVRHNASASVVSLLISGHGRIFGHRVSASSEARRAIAFTAGASGSTSIGDAPLRSAAATTGSTGTITT